MALVRRILDAVGAYGRDLRREPRTRWRALALVVTVAVVVHAVRVLYTPFFADTSTHGFRDWDSQSTFHYIAPLSLLRYHELPWWNPWLCGGFPAWAYVEGVPNLVSPYLPFYLLFPVQVAERLEVVFSTLCALAFAYLLAGRITKSVAARALVSVTYGLNGRWVLQISEGHTWHLQYAWLPLAIYTFDVSLERGRMRYAAYTGIVLALQVYMGGLYPVPHTALVLFLYSAFLVVAWRTIRPLVSLAVSGSVAVGVAAPKLLPLLSVMRLHPRTIDSHESVDLGQLIMMFTDTTGAIDTDHDPFPGMAIGWYEFGTYVGVWVTAAILLAMLVPAGSARAKGLRIAGIVFLLLGCGSFHPYAPWTLLHRLPSFSSQHMPMRFLMPAVLLLVLSFVALVAEPLERRIRRRPWLDLALLVPLAFVASDLAGVGVRSTTKVFQLHAPATIVPSDTFHHVDDLTYRYDPDWHQIGRQSLLSMYANTGVIRCYGIPRDFKPGAIAVGAAGYRGEAYVAEESSSQAEVTRFTPNSATIRFSGAHPGETLVYNMNYDAGWSTSSGRAIDYHGAVGAKVDAVAGEVTFRYRPPLLGWGLLVFALTVAALVRSSRLWPKVAGLWGAAKPTAQA
jgi:hypothetical protein